MDSTAAEPATGASAEVSLPPKNPHRRVKVYMLNADRAWDDKGTGHVSCAYVDQLQGMALVVRSEDDDRSVILESKIAPTTAYQKQQETLICWSENDQELALSFQLIDSCSEIWEKICDVQGRDPGDVGQDDSLQDSREEDNTYDDAYPGGSLVELPAADLAHLEDIQSLFGEYTLHAGVVQWRVDKLANSIEAENYIPKLLEIYTMSDDLENEEALHQLYSIFKTIFMLNRNSLFEIMFSSDNLMKVVGVMENDPTNKTPVKHREFLQNQAKFHHVLPLSNDALLDKIHQTYRVQYIQDVILPTPSVFDDNLLSALNSFIFFNKCEIVKMIQENESLMKVLFQQLTDDETDDNARRNLVRFLKEFCTFSATLQASERDQFYQMLSEMRLLEAIETLWNLEDPDILSTTNDIFAFIVEANPSLVREFCLSEAKLGQDDLLLTKAIEQMQSDPDQELGGSLLLSVTIRLLIDPENMLTNALRTEKTEFLNYFYLHCMPALISPLRGLTVDTRTLKEDYSTAQLLNLTVEMLAFCAEHHSYQFRVHMIKHELLRKILYLLKSKHAFLALCAVRFLRRLVNLKDDTYSRHIVQYGLLKPVCDAFLLNGDRYNLFNSAVIELFEYIRTESLKLLATNFVEYHYKNGFQHIKYVKTFQQLKDQFDNRPTSNTSLAAADDGVEGIDTFSAMARQRRYRRDNSSFDEEEEMWFEKEDEPTEAASVDAAGNKTPPFDHAAAADEVAMEDNVAPWLAMPTKPLIKDDEDDDSAFGNGPKLQRAISINLKSLTSAVDSPPPPGAHTVTPPPPGAHTVTPHGSPVSPLTNLSPIVSSRSPLTPAATVTSTTGISKTSLPLVDYPDEDSDEDYSETDGTTPAKRARVSST